MPVFYGTFERDTQALGKIMLVGQPGADAVLEANTGGVLLQRVRHCGLSLSISIRRL